MRKPDPENIYLARRVATLSRLTRPGMPQERTEALVAAGGRGWRSGARAAFCGVLGGQRRMDKGTTPAASLVAFVYKP